MSSAPRGTPPLDHPWYGIGFGGAVKRFFTKYATFHGRASRSEFWWCYLFWAIGLLVVFGAGVPAIVAGSGSASSSGTPAFGAGAYVGVALPGLFVLGTVVPLLAVAVRRLHDTGQSGLYVLLGLVPFFGPMIVLVLLLIGTTPAAERYGPPRSPYPPPGYGAPGPYGQAHPPA